MQIMSAPQQNSDVFSAGNRLDKDGRFWRILFRGEKASCRNRKGLSYLIPLLQNPGSALNVLQIQHISELPDEFIPSVVASTTALSGEETSVSCLDLPDQHLPVTEQLRQLWDAIEVAQAKGDAETRQQLENHQQYLLRSIGQVQDANGELFELNKQQHNIRSKICQQIRNVVRKDLAAALPELAAHLERSLSYGLECTYQPNAHTQWQVSRAG